MRSNLKLVVNNPHKQIEERQFFEKDELKIILDLYAKMVSEGSWRDYGLNISSKQVSFSVFRNAAENALYKICKNFKPKNKNLKYLITDTSGKILKNLDEYKIKIKKKRLKFFQLVFFNNDLRSKEFLRILPVVSVIKYLRFLFLGLKFLQILYKAFSAAFLNTLKLTCLLEIFKP